MLILIALAIFIGLSFIEALHAGYVYWDDDDLLLLETRYRTLNPGSLRWMFTTFYAGHYQPLTWLSYWVDWNLWDGDVFGFHLGNVMLHTISGFLVYFIARNLILMAAQGHRQSPPNLLLSLAAGVSAALFAVHPLRVESVAWIAERRDVLSGTFFFLAILAYLKYVQQQRSLCGRISYFIVLMSMALSLLAKASAVMLPPVLLVLDWYPLRRFRRQGSLVRHDDASPLDVAGVRGDSLRKVLVEKIPLFLLAVVGGALAVEAQSSAGAMYPLTQYGLGLRIAQAAYGLTFYLWKTLTPIGLGPLYEIPRVAELLGPALWISGSTVLCGVAALLFLRRKAPWLLAATAAYVLLLFPVLGFFQSGPQLVADRYSYLSCAGFAVLLGGGLTWIGDRLRPERLRGPRLALILLVVLTLAGLHKFTDRQCKYWNSPLSLWHRGVIVSPQSSIAHANYADALAQAEFSGPAIAHYRRAIELNPRNVVATAHLGDLLGLLNEPEAAIRLYERTLELEPRRPHIHHKLADLMVRSRRIHEAVALLEARARTEPADLDSLELLADVLSSHPDSTVRDPQRALHWIEKLLSANAQHGAALMYLATAQAQSGQIELAMSIGEKVLKIAESRLDLRLAREMRRRMHLFRQQGGLYPTPPADHP